MMLEKADIVHIGTVDDSGEPHHWVFDAHGRLCAALEITKDGDFLYAGYTVEELRKITTDYLNSIYG